MYLVCWQTIGLGFPEYGGDQDPHASAMGDSQGRWLFGIQIRPKAGPKSGGLILGPNIISVHPSSIH